jgi:hypothetical protein
VTVTLLVYAAFFQIADVIQVTCISALRGYKDTSIPMIIMLFSFWGVGLPLGWVLTFTDWLLPNMGAAGFWVGLTCGLVSAGILLGLRLFLFVPEPEQLVGSAGVSPVNHARQDIALQKTHYRKRADTQQRTDRQQSNDGQSKISFKTIKHGVYRNMDRPE